MSTNEPENLNAKLADLEIKVRVLEKLYDQALQALAKASVAEKTADKALAMAQEALVLVMKPASDMGNSEPYEFPFPTAETIARAPKSPNINGPTDEDLTKKLEEAESANEFS
jgi:DNA uptake protein ComE-like DNA-binding protein